MRDIRIRLGGGMLIGLLVVSGLDAATLHGGRTLEDERDFGLRITAGQISDFNAIVQETTRSLYDVTGSYWKQDDAENYDLDDFNIDDNHGTIGLSLEKAWRFFTFQFDTSLMDIESSAIAHRNYYIGVGDAIEYQGQSYDRMQIPEGTPFDFSVMGGAIDTKLMGTPFSLQLGSGLTVTPMLGIGLFGFVGDYDIDAGPVEGVKTYQDPPKEFAIKGRSSGIVGLGLPEYGGGLEIRMGQPQHLNLVCQGHYMMLEYDGSSSFLTSSAHREKNVEIDHVNIRGRLYLEMPLNHSRYLMLGVQYQDVTSDGFISSTATDPETILEKQERFDKEVEFSMSALQAMVGLAW